MELHEVRWYGSSKGSNRVLVKVFAHTWQVRVAVVTRASSMQTTRNRAEDASSSWRGLIAYVNVPTAAARNNSVLV